MEDFLLELLVTIAEMLFEALLATLSEVSLAFLARRIVRVFNAILRLDPLVAGVGAMLLGAGAGALSVLLFPHSFAHTLHLHSVHGLSLIVSPLLTGLAMSRIGRSLRTRRRKTLPIESFSYGFAFAFAMAFIRYVFVQ